MNKVDGFLKRFERAKQNKTNWKSHLDEAFDLFNPNRNSFNDPTKGNRRMTQVYDSVGIEALQEFANNVKDKLLPSHQKWSTIKPAGLIESEVFNGKVSRDERDELARQMEIMSNIIFQYIWHSNFDMASHEAIQDMGISLGALLCLDTGNVDSPIEFHAVPVDQLMPEPSSLGTVETVFREHQVYVRDLSVMFPKAPPVELDPNKQVNVIEGTLWNSEDNNYQYCVYIKDANKQDFFFEDEYEVSPWILFRWSVSSGEVWGRGPAMNALPSMKILNKLVAQLIYNNDMAINPPLIVNTGSSLLDVGSINITPNSILPTKSDFSGQQQAFQYLQTSASFNVGENMRNQYHNQIKGLFHLHQIGTMSDTTKSATEIQIRNQQALAQQAASFGRLQTELVSRIVKRVHYILSSYGITPKQLKIDDKVAHVVATSPLAKVQDLADLENAMNFIQLGFNMGEAGMAMVASAIDSGKIGRFIAQKMGVPAQLLLSEEQQQALAAQAQQAMMNGQMPIEAPAPNTQSMPVV